MFSRFFIDRPILAAVLSIFIVIAGLAAMRILPIAQYPEIAPPVVTVRAVYPGASAEVIEQTVAAPLENQINGVEHMIYMSSSSGSNGVVEIQVTFDIGIDVDQAALNVNNRVKQAEPRLPEEVRRQGVTVEKGSSSFLQVLAFTRPTGVTTTCTSATTSRSTCSTPSSACRAPPTSRSSAPRTTPCASGSSPTA
jgi:multidrug efflux pump